LASRATRTDPTGASGAWGRQRLLLWSRENHAKVLAQRCERTLRILGDWPGRLGYDQVEVLVALRLEVAQRVVDAEHHLAALDVLAEQLASAHQLERDGPASHLGVPI